MSMLPRCEHLLLHRQGPHLQVTLNRPEARNALSDAMLAELSALLEAVAPDRTLASLVLRGAGGTFCAGGDLKGFKAAFEAPPAAGEPDPIALDNRRFGAFMTRLDSLPQAVVALVEGAAFGGGLGLVCASDVALCHADTRFALSETGLGIPPAQIAPFVVRRVGLGQARRLALTGARFDGREAGRIGLVQEVCEDAAALTAGKEAVLEQIGRCAPAANAATKAILRASLEQPLAQVLDGAAQAFAAALRGPEGREGVSAFMQKRSPQWHRE
jgi:isohexenylglutaconyl-CoA hydratase